MRILVFLILFFSSFASFGRMPASPYYFPAPTISDLIPFSETELKLIQEHDILFVTIHHYEDVKTNYHFERGKLIFQEDIWVKKGANEPINYTEYKYNDNGSLISKRFMEKEYEILDSITYDTNNRIIGYYSHRKSSQKKRSKRYTEVDWNLKFLSAEEDFYTLVDSNYVKDNRTYIVNNQNEIIKVNSNYRIDSIAFNLDKTNGSIKTYWFKQVSDTAFNKGREIVYKNDLIQYEVRFHRDGRVVRSYNYTYNQDNQLLRKEDSSPYGEKEFYTYNDFGLIALKIKVNNPSFNIIEYFYREY